MPRGFTDDNWNRIPEDLSGYLLTLPGDLVLNKMKAWQGSLGVSGSRGIVSPAYFVYSPVRGDYEPRFLHALLRSAPFIESYTQMSGGIRVDQWDLDPWAFSRLQIPLPPLPEQRAIAGFLDRETARIDALIEKQTTMIALLKERRAAVIESVLLTGARILALGFYIATLPGYAFPSEEFDLEAVGVPLLRGVNIKPGEIVWDEVVHWPKRRVVEVQRYLLAPGDVVLASIFHEGWLVDGPALLPVSWS